VVQEKEAKENKEVTAENFKAQWSPHVPAV
jgi:hypothetical protein